MTDYRNWAAIAGYEGRYYVSNRGEVESLVYPDYPRTLKPGYLRTGHPYRLVTLTNEEGYRKTHLLHRLVAKGFIPNPDNLPVVRHLDGDITNNRALNLAWGTHGDNAKDAVRHGTTARGSRSGMAKLNEAKVMNMRDEYRLLGTPCRILGEMYGVAESTAWFAITGRTWAHVPGAVNIKDN